MKKIKFSWYLSIGYANGNRSDIGEIEVKEDATEEEIEDAISQAVNDEVNNYIQISWNQI